MSEPPTPPGKDKKKGGLLTGKNKWYLVGALALIAVLVFVFVRKSNANATGTTSTTGTTSGLDPTTEAALTSALQAQAGQAYSQGTTATGAQGPAGPAGPAGPTGATGAKGATGATGGTMSSGTATKAGSTPTPPKPASSQSYTVKAGDTLASVAAKFGISIATLAHANTYVPGEVAGNAKVGQTLGTGAGLKTGQVLTVPHVAAAK